MEHQGASSDPAPDVPAPDLPAQALPAPAELAQAMQLLSLRLRRAGERHLGVRVLPRSELEVLIQVIDHPRPTITDVARDLGLQTSNVSTTVHQLVEKGLLERVPNPEDRRSTQLVPTAAALADKDVVDAAWAEVIGAFLAGQSEHDRNTLLAATPMLAALARLSEDRT